MAEIKFDSSYAGYVYKGAGTVWHLRDDGRFNGVSASLDGQTEALRFLATGLKTTASDGSIMLNIEGDGFYDWIDLSSGEWTRVGMGTVYSQAQAQSYVDKLIENNKHILMNNLFCARYKDKLTAEQQTTLYNLESRLYERNNRLQYDGLVSNKTSSEAYGYGDLSPYLTSFMQQGVGLVISTTAIIISCVVVASLATAAYFAYKYYYEQSAQDVKYSDALTKTLMSKLTAEEYEQLKKETQGIVTKASLRARLGGSWDIVKIAIMAFGVYTLYTFITTTNKTKKTHGLQRRS